MEEIPSQTKLSVWDDIKDKREKVWMKSFEESWKEVGREAQVGSWQDVA